LGTLPNLNFLEDVILKKKDLPVWGAGAGFWLLEVNVHPEEKLPKARSSYFSFFFHLKFFVS